VVPAVGAQRAAFHVPLVVEGVAAAQALGQVAVAVAVGFVGEAAGEQRRRAAAGIDAIGMLVGDVGAEPAAFGAATDAAAGFAQAVAATAELEVRGEIALVAAGEDLDHATDGVGAVQAGLRAAHDFHALDLRQRQVLVHGQAEVGAVDAHAIDQHHGVARVGAAQEQRALLAEPAGIGQVDAGAAAQQFLQRGGLAGFDLRAVDHLGRRDAVLQGDRGAGGGDQDLVERGGVIGGLGQRGQGGQHGQGQHSGLQLHGDSRCHARPRGEGRSREGRHAPTPQRRLRSSSAMPTASRPEASGPVSGLAAGWREATVQAPSHACGTVALLPGTDVLTVAGAAPAWRGITRHRLPVSTCRPWPQVTWKCAQSTASQAARSVEPARLPLLCL
jgi:hypothetical protein